MERPRQNRGHTTARPDIARTHHIDTMGRFQKQMPWQYRALTIAMPRNSAGAPRKQRPQNRPRTDHGRPPEIPPDHKQTKHTTRRPRADQRQAADIPRVDHAQTTGTPRGARRQTTGRPRKYHGHATYIPKGTMGDHGQTAARPLTYHRQTTGRPQAEHGNTTGSPQACHGQTMDTPCTYHGQTTGRIWIHIYM